MEIRQRYCLLLALVVPWLLSAAATAQQDSLTLQLQEVETVEHFRVEKLTTATPVQAFTRGQLQNLNAMQLSDAVKHFAGVSIKDYGGLGGMKTVSVRSMGAQHTAISYDGVTLSDTQSGQIDISRFSLENVESLQLANGQSADILCTARQMAAASLLQIQTQAPVFEAGRRHRAKLSLGAGSFGLLQPSIRWEQRLGEHWAYRLAGEHCYSNGRYPYTLAYGTAGDSVAHKIRRHNQVHNTHLEAELYGQPKVKAQWRSKIYYYQSQKELPNATTFYNDNQQAMLRERQAFLQSTYRQELSDIWSIQAALKYQNSYQGYFDQSSLATELGTKEYHYYQQEYYGSFSALYRCLPGLSLALNNDLAVNQMQAEGLSDFAEPTRYSLLSGIAAKYHNPWLTANASLLGSLIKETVKYGNAGHDYLRWSPYASLSVKPFEGEYYLRSFIKHSFRLPSFNDLYYGPVGNVDLKPETAMQYNLGLTWAQHLSEWFPLLQGSIDAYYNRVDDKIVAIPTKNLFVWSMMNLGRVDIHGLDVACSAGWQAGAAGRIGLSAHYSYQRALDHTSKEGSSGKVYGHQIAYIPLHSGGGQLSFETPYGTLAYAVMISGDRYVLGQNIAANRLEGYSDHSLSYRKDLRWKNFGATFKLEVLNLLDENYAVIKYFPMPGRSLRGSLSITL